MITSAFKAAWSVFVTGVLLYFFFFVPLGERTLFEHVRRIAATDEARALGHDVRGAGERIRGELGRTVGDVITAESAAGDTAPAE